VGAEPVQLGQIDGAVVVDPVPLPSGRPMTRHNGGTGGFSTCAAFRRESGTAVVMMTNTLARPTESTSSPVDALTAALLDDLDATA
jgi:D-alanyl-D-alanine-carboxypeptidase/D-alanyl-D-alanine-endopeptidase